VGGAVSTVDLHVPALAPAASPEAQRAARRALLDQVARLERRLGEAVASGFPHTHLGAARVAPAAAGPQLLSLGELEALRDRLSAALRAAHDDLEVVGAKQAEARLRLEALLREPRRHKFEQVRRADLGEAGCGAYQVRPRLGLVGMLAGWWHVKLSSGCPLRRPAAA
jgi:hypothetical protein